MEAEELVAPVEMVEEVVGGGTKPEKTPAVPPLPPAPNLEAPPPPKLKGVGMVVGPGVLVDTEKPNILLLPLEEDEESALCF